MDLIVAAFHAVTFVVYAFGIYFDHCHLIMPVGSTVQLLTFKVIGGRWKYLTYIDMVLQCAFFGLCLLNDFIGSSTTNPRHQSALQKLRDGLFATLVYPLGLFVPCVFWGLYAVDRDLIFPEAMDAWFPAWLNHVMHTLPAIGVLLELLNTNHTYPRGWRKLCTPILLATGLYLSWICYIAHAAGVWVYPVLAALDFKSRIVFFVAMHLPILLFLYSGQKLHSTIWGATKEHQYQSKKKSKKN